MLVMKCCLPLIALSVTTICIINFCVLKYKMMLDSASLNKYLPLFIFYLLVFSYFLQTVSQEVYDSFSFK